MAIEQTTLTLDGQTYSAPLKTHPRSVKGETLQVSTLDDLREHEHAIALQVIERRAMGPEACHFLRSQLEQTAEQLYPAFGVSRKTFYRWSKCGEMPTATWLLLARIIRERDEGRTDTLDMLLQHTAQAS